jgi:hypothetical protein
MEAPVTRAELDRESARWREELLRVEQHVTAAEQARWTEHGRQHADERSTLLGLRADFKEAFLGFDQVLTELGNWRAEVRGQLTVLKWLLALVTGVLVPVVALLVARLL